MVDTATNLHRVWIATPKVVYLVLLVLLGITFADLKDRERTFDNADTRILQDIFENVNKAPIYDIQIASNTGDCPFNYDPVILGEWGGSIEGCLCGSTYYAGACISLSSGCSTVSAINSSSFNISDGVRFCVARMLRWEKPYKTGTCLFGYMLCPANICVPSIVPCPITDLRYTSPSTIPTDYSSISISSSLSLAFTNQVRDAAITSLKVSLYDRPCMDPDAMPYTTDGEAYILSVVPENGCGGTGTVEHLQQISSKNASELFSENNMNTIVTSLPGFSSYISGQNAFFVGVRQYLTMNQSGSCPTISTSYITNCKSYENSFANNVHGTLIAALVVVSVIFVLTIIEFVFLARRKEEDYWTRFFSIVNLLTFLGFCGLCVIIGGIAAYTKQKLSSDVAVLNYLASNQCFKQEVVNRILQALRGNVSNFYAILWLSISLLIVACVGIIATILIGLINIGYAKRHGDSESYYVNAGKGFKRKEKGTGTGTGTGVQTGAMPQANIEMLISNKSIVKIK